MFNDSESNFRRDLQIWNAIRVTKMPNWELRASISRVVCRMSASAPASSFYQVFSIPQKPKFILSSCTFLEFSKFLCYCRLSWISLPTGFRQDTPHCW